MGDQLLSQTSCADQIKVITYLVPHAHLKQSNFAVELVLVAPIWRQFQASRGTHDALQADPAAD